jgi:hypothetical protein
MARSLFWRTERWRLADGRPVRRARQSQRAFTTTRPRPPNSTDVHPSAGRRRPTAEIVIVAIYIRPIASFEPDHIDFVDFDPSPHTRTHRRQFWTSWSKAADSVLRRTPAVIAIILPRSVLQSLGFTRFPPTREPEDRLLRPWCLFLHHGPPVQGRRGVDFHVVCTSANGVKGC